MNITKTRLATFGPEYKLLNGLVFPSLSKTIILSTFLNTSCEGISLFVSTSPINSADGSTPLKEVSIEVFGGVELGDSMIIRCGDSSIYFSFKSFSVVELIR